MGAGSDSGTAQGASRRHSDLQVCTYRMAMPCTKNNTDAVVKKAQQRLFFLRQLKTFGLRREILVQFYRSATESVPAFSIFVWFGGISQR